MEDWAKNGIEVSGTGYAEGEPDVAYISLGFTARALVLEAAREETARRMAVVIEALKHRGIETKDIRTSNYDVWRDSKQKLHEVSTDVRVTVRNVAKVGALLDVAIEAGANDIRGIRFGIEDRTELEALARERAVSDAVGKAAQLARLTGVELGAPLHISEEQYGYGGYGDMAAPAVMEAAAPRSATPVEAGELRVSVSVQIRYGIA